jgi:hypothetical protein
MEIAIRPPDAFMHLIEPLAKCFERSAVVVKNLKVIGKVMSKPSLVLTIDGNIYPRFVVTMAYETEDFRLVAHLKDFNFLKILSRKGLI